LNIANHISRIFPLEYPFCGYPKATVNLMEYLVNSVCQAIRSLPQTVNAFIVCPSSEI